MVWSHFRINTMKSLVVNKYELIILNGLLDHLKHGISISIIHANLHINVKTITLVLPSPFRSNEHSFLTSGWVGSPGALPKTSKACKGQGKCWVWTASPCKRILEIHVFSSFSYRNMCLRLILFIGRWRNQRYWHLLMQSLNLTIQSFHILIIKGKNQFYLHA